MASNITSLKEQIKEDMLTCSLCLEIFKTPKCLPCLHSFCERCLQTWVTKNAGQLVCPICRLKVNSNVSDLQTNFLLTGLSDYMATVKELENDINKCAACDEGVAVTRCTDCAEYLCKSCTTAHRRLKITKGHQVIDLAHYTSEVSLDVEIPQPIVYCDKHEQSPVEIYCETCRIPVCTKCALIEHPTPKHRHQHMEDAAEKGKHHLRPLLKQLKDTINSTSDATNNIDQELQNLRHFRDDTEKRIDEHVQIIIDKLLKKQSQAKKKLNTIFESKNQSLESQKKNLELTKVTLESVDDYAENLMKFASPSQCLLSLKNVIDRVNQVLKTEIEIKPKEDSRIWFVANNALITEHIGNVHSSVEVEGLTKLIILGKEMQNTGSSSLQKQDIIVKLVNPSEVKEIVPISPRNSGSLIQSNINFKELGKHSLTVKHCNQKVKDMPYEITVIPPVETVQCFGSKGSAPSFFKAPHGVAINHNGHIVVCDSGNHRVQILDWNGRCMKCLTFNQFPKQFWPMDVSVSADGRYFISDVNNKQIVVCTEDQLITTFDQNEGIGPQGITLTNDGYVLFIDRQDDRHCIRKYTVDGLHVMAAGKTGFKVGEFMKPYSIAVNKKDQIIVSEFGNHCIQVFDSHFHHIFSFGSIGSGENQFKGPCGLDVDSDDNIYICDPNNKRVCKYSHDGRFLCLIAEGEWDFPTRIVVSKVYPLKIAVSEFRKNEIKVVYL
ncbi:E3 ubiquitin-protein ligase TRIM45-like [Saccoglossus kowalevskii]